MQSEQLFSCPQQGVVIEICRRFASRARKGTYDDRRHPAARVCTSVGVLCVAAPLPFPVVMATPLVPRHEDSCVPRTICRGSNEQGDPFAQPLTACSPAFMIAVRRDERESRQHPAIDIKAKRSRGYRAKWQVPLLAAVRQPCVVHGDCMLWLVLLGLSCAARGIHRLGKLSPLLTRHLYLLEQADLWLRAPDRLAVGMTGITGGHARSQSEVVRQRGMADVVKVDCEATPSEQRLVDERCVP